MARVIAKNGCVIQTTSLRALGIYDGFEPKVCCVRKLKEVYCGRRAFGLLDPFFLMINAESNQSVVVFSNLAACLVYTPIVCLLKYYSAGFVGHRWCVCQKSFPPVRGVSFEKCLEKLLCDTEKKCINAHTRHP